MHFPLGRLEKKASLIRAICKICLCQGIAVYQKQSSLSSPHSVFPCKGRCCAGAGRDLLGTAWWARPRRGEERFPPDVLAATSLWPIHTWQFIFCLISQKCRSDLRADKYRIAPPKCRAVYEGALIKSKRAARVSAEIRPPSSSSHINESAGWSMNEFMPGVAFITLKYCRGQYKGVGL